jgi:peptidoglycan/xylan/chitin deacetylase (PgdA/CDA1 family)
MYQETPLTGAGMPNKFLSLTYDDGPGENTLEIARFLFEHGVRATFFVVGKFAIQFDNVLKEVSEMGHLIANHTFEHPDMPYYLSRNGDVQSQIMRTDAVIGKYNKSTPVYFRSPYGKWSKEVADNLNSNIVATLNHIGPIHWDIAGIDCYYWRNNITVEEAVKRYLKDIREKDRGIIVMHDEIADMEFLRVNNKTLELTKQLIPKLKSEGYQFVRLDEVDLLPRHPTKPSTVTLKTQGGKYLYLSEDTSIAFYDANSKAGRNYDVTILPEGKIALQGVNGLYLSLRANNGNRIEAIETQIGDNEKFDFIPLHDNRFMLRAFNGMYFNIQHKQNGTLTADAEFMRGAEIFLMSFVGVTTKKRFSLIRKIRSLRRQFLYIKSKLRQG